jgi:predicted nuclease with TOPRIM domain
MSSPSPEELQKEFNSVRNKQVEIFDRLNHLEGQLRQLTESVRKLEDIVIRLDVVHNARTPTSDSSHRFATSSSSFNKMAVRTTALGRIQSFAALQARTHRCLRRRARN